MQLCSTTKTETLKLKKNNNNNNNNQKKKTIKLFPKLNSLITVCFHDKILVKKFYMYILLYDYTQRIVYMFHLPTDQFNHTLLSV